MLGEFWSDCVFYCWWFTVRNSWECSHRKEPRFAKQRQWTCRDAMWTKSLWISVAAVFRLWGNKQPDPVTSGGQTYFWWRVASPHCLGPQAIVWAWESLPECSVGREIEGCSSTIGVWGPQDFSFMIKLIQNWKRGSLGFTGKIWNSISFFPTSCALGALRVVKGCVIWNWKRQRGSGREGIPAHP